MHSETNERSSENKNNKVPTDDEKNKLELVTSALKNENKIAENRNAEQERKVNDNLRDYDDMKSRFQALERKLCFETRERGIEE